MSKKNQHKKKHDDEIFEGAEEKLKQLQEVLANANVEADKPGTKTADYFDSASVFDAKQPKKTKKKAKKQEKKQQKHSDSELSESDNEPELEDEQKRRQNQTHKQGAHKKQDPKVQTQLDETIRQLKKKIQEDSSHQPKKSQKDKKKAKSSTKADKNSDLTANIGLKKSSECNYCSLIIIGVLFFMLLFTKLQEEKYVKFMRYNRNQDISEDLYEVLEIDAAASLPDIKRQYKKLALAWHPDKNPGCGKECHEKFNKISNAYTILSNPEKRQQYDESSGVFTPIRSQTISLTSHNFRRLVQDSDDLWIIQIYEDGNPQSEAFAGIWDEAAMKFDGTAKFGRINAGLQLDVLKELPFKIHFYPTIIALPRHSHPDIFTFPPNIAAIFAQLKKFIEKNIANHVKFYDATSFDSLNRTHISKNSAIYLNTNKESQTMYQKYAAYKYHQWIEFYQSKFGEAKKLAANKKLPSHEFIQFKYKTDKEEHSTSNYFFSSLSRDNLKQVLSLGKFISIPDFSKETFNSFCIQEGRSISGSQEEESTSSDPLKSSLCILIIDDGHELEKVSKHLKQARSFQLEQVHDIADRIKKSQGLFESYEIFQVGSLTLQQHKRMANLLQAVKETNEIKKLYALALNPTNNKAVFYDGKESFDDWLLDLYETDEDHDDTIYLNELLKGNEFEDFLRGKDDTAFSILYNEVAKQINNTLTLTACVLILLANKYLLKKSLEYSALSAVAIVAIFGFGMAFYQQREELF